ncbi:MAG: geranylgeranylglycerol-phosphate geranylgeranyltransferase [Chitinophagaceae bacterium]|nr:geranylgeranylglycerol-phosphate geranylgeranyltransferase [Chitinophagaceae bacterium]
MKLITAFLRLVRLTNLVMIAVTQVLFYFTIVEPFYSNNHDAYIPFSIKHFLLLILSSILIAAAGNIINDYFDRNIDEINKPEKKIIDKLIKRRWAIIMHIVFSFVAILIGFYIDSQTPVFWLGISNTVCVMLLFGYSISLKKKLLVGNILISMLTAWVILVCFVCYYRSFSCSYCDAATWQGQLNRFIRISFLYAGFAFVISLIREVVKDMEDMEGDKRYGCKTIPISWGIPASKVFVAVWLVVLIGMISIVQIYVLQLGWYWSAVFAVLLIIAPLLWILRKLYQAQVPKDYHRLSTVIKLVMLAGLVSMIFFKIYS